MEPKERAVEIFKRYSGEVIVTTHAEAKQCALICVEIQLSNAGFIWGGHNHETGNSARDEYRKYWNQVKEELLKL